MKIPNCLQCKHLRAIPGDTHSSCTHPTMSNGGIENPINRAIVELAITGDFNRIVELKKAELKITANETGVKNGWFLWPYNFDPYWLESCDGFEQK